MKTPRDKLLPREAGEGDHAQRGGGGAARVSDAPSVSRSSAAATSPARSATGEELVVTDAASFAATTGATAEQMVDLERYRVLLGEWNERMNLVGPSALAEFWPRHAYDSAQLLAHAPDAVTWADLGAGAGFPGVILAILLKGRTGAKVHLVESMAKRCRFLQAVADELALPVEVHNSRAENLSLTVDIVTARACAPLGRLLEFARPYFKKGAAGLFLKGQDVEAELAEATTSWVFAADLLPSQSGSGRIVRIGKAPKIRVPGERRHGR